MIYDLRDRYVLELIRYPDSNLHFIVEGRDITPMPKPGDIALVGENKYEFVKVKPRLNGTFMAEMKHAKKISVGPT